ncbi:phosphatidate cytidylyltransferase [Paenirhodobacter populi]|uniref:Phosphatidate cytidylyltransferase n=1 Tax=Paenirhodobacter populi TaxID=2306993 RepID=A0A443JU01_9RHOB|nr:phosphatidate cytidylyltransferase [Sinirhodobacter populi]RWR23972.1 phosphatidate cytidylyltransferase [Sinirhodobacter populi]
MKTPASPGRWSDLGPRLGSGLVMLLLGAAAIWAGGVVFATLAVVVSALMVWELAAMLVPARRARAVVLGLLAGAALAAIFVLHSPFALALLIVPSLAGLWRLARRDWLVWGLYAFAIMLTGYGLVALRDGLNAPQGLRAIVWIIAVVVVSDVMGYFAGRTLGGPKFWPRISPKKTWSGTVAGWIGAMLVGAVYALSGIGGWGLLLLSPLLAFAGQLGDIAESWIKRRSGVKDSSALIPGHGGVLDRFDALIGAVLMVLLVAQFGTLPFVGG